MIIREVVPGRLSVRRTMITVEGDVLESEPMTRRGKRQIALDSSTVEALREWRATQLRERMAWGPGWDDTGFIFTREDGRALHPDRASYPT